MKLTLKRLLQDELRALRRAETRTASAFRHLSALAFDLDLHDSLAARADQCVQNLRFLNEVDCCTRYVPIWKERDLSEILAAAGDAKIDPRTSSSIADHAIVADALRIAHYFLARYRAAAGLSLKLRLRYLTQTLKKAFICEQCFARKLEQIQAIADRPALSAVKARLSASAA